MNIIACIPVKIPAEIAAQIGAHNPTTEYPPKNGRYKQVPCPVCEEAMWIGPKSAQMAEAGDAEAICVTCLFALGIADADTNVQSLT